MVMFGDGCEGVPAVVENCEFAVLVIVDDSAGVELSVVDSGEVDMVVKVDEDCVVWPSVVDICGNSVVIVVDESGAVWLYVVDPGEVSVDVRVDGYCDV